MPRRSTAALCDVLLGCCYGERRDGWAKHRFVQAEHSNAWQRHCDAMFGKGLAQQGEAMAEQREVKQRQGATKPSGGVGQQCQARGRRGIGARGHGNAGHREGDAEPRTAKAPQSCAMCWHRRARQGQGMD